MPAERPKFDFLGALESYQEQQEKLRWEGSFSEYVQKVVENPKIVRSAHKLAYDALTSRPDFFTTGPNALYGAEKATDKFIDVLKGGAEGLEVRKRIILLIGPPGSGKSTLVNGTKRGIEEFSKTDEGASYQIKDCPMQEEPLHLVPTEARGLFEEKLGVHIEGDLCPDCNQKYGKKPLSDRLSEVKVERFAFAEKDRKGIGTFKPSDPKSQDMTELVGSVDLSKLGEIGSASDARAYRFDGELNVANRGVMEFVEMLKSDERFLYSLLDLTQDRVIKAPRFANIYADEVILAHTNMTEYNNYVNNPKNEALKDRMYVIEVPYNLKVSEEKKIYEKLIKDSDKIKKSEIHMNPHTLEVAANFAVLSRLEESKKAGMTKLKKLKIYDGQEADGVSQRDLKELQEEIPTEGMRGISPRYIIDSLSTALIEKDKKCLTPLDAIRSLRDNMEHHPHTRDLKQEEKDKIRENINTVKREFDEVAKKEIQTAFIYSYEDTARSLATNYLANMDAYVTNHKVLDPITGEETPVDEQLLRSIEVHINISENGKQEFRREIMNRIGSKALRNERFDYTDHPRLKQAIEKKLFADMKDIVKLTTSSRVPNEDQQKRLGEVQERLMQERGFCDHCSGELIRYAGNLLAK